MNYTEDDNINKVIEGLRILYDKDKNLFEYLDRRNRLCNERSLTFRLGFYLIDLFPEYDVDCEYNKDREDVKRAIINVHKRKDDINNLFVIEAKKYNNSNKEEREKDDNKLKYMTSLDNQYKYKYGIFIDFGTNFGNTKIIVYQNGKDIMSVNLGD